MFSIIDRYIIRKFLTTFLFMLGVIMILSVVFDVADKINEFVRLGATAHQIIFDHYVNFVILYANMFSPLIIFISVIWFTSKMAQNTEIIPIWNSGRSFGRFVRPYMIAATVLVIPALLFNHFLVPNANKVRLAFEEKYYWNNMYVEDYHAEFPGNQVVYFSSYSSDTRDASDFIVEDWDEEGNLESILKAKSARNKEGTKEWVLSNYYERVIEKDKDVISQGLKKDTTFQFSVDEMATRDNVAESMNYFEIKEFIAREKAKGSPRIPRYEIVQYERTALPFSTFILTIIGLAVASRKKRGGIGMNIAIGIFFAFGFIFAMQVTSVSAMNLGFPAYIAVWIPNLIFGTIAYFMYRRVQR